MGGANGVHEKESHKYKILFGDLAGKKTLGRAGFRRKYNTVLHKHNN
jgi:hypothetical protein